jgi:preprotein translocase subunit YajC
MALGTNAVAFAQAAPNGQAQPSMLEVMAPFAVMIAIFYFLIIRPQSKKQKEQTKFLSELKRGDEVVTQSGILGKIDGLTDQFITLDVGGGVKFKMLRSQILASSKAITQTQEAK